MQRSAVINEHQKMIHIADRSEHGWGMVKAYMADDSKDKRTEMVERAAECKAVKRRKRQKVDILLTMLSGGQLHDPTVPLGSPHPAVYLLPHALQPPRWQAVPAVSRPLELCHFCGEMGHLRL